MLDSGCTYSLMSRTLWENIKKMDAMLSVSQIPKFIMAHESKAIVKTILLLSLHDACMTIRIHVLGDHQLCMLLLLGLDFMCASQNCLKATAEEKCHARGKGIEVLTQEWGHAEPTINLLHGSNGQ